MVQLVKISCSLLNFELFQILETIFKHYKVTSQQMDIYVSLKDPKIEMMQKKLIFFLESSFTVCTFILFFQIFSFAFLYNGP